MIRDFLGDFQYLLFLAKFDQFKDKIDPETFLKIKNFFDSYFKEINRIFKAQANTIRDLQDQVDFLSKKLYSNLDIESQEDKKDGR